jgi:HEAT repeat protein
MFGNEANVALAGRIKDPAATVRKAALQALAIAATWRYLPAQQGLITVATDPTWDPQERALAVDGIGAAIKLQAGGAFQDPPLFKALVTLLDDADLAMRTRAFALLSPIMASGYKPDGTPADRMAAIVPWQQWLAGITAKP